LFGGSRRKNDSVDPEDLVVGVSLKRIINALVKKEKRVVSSRERDKFRVEAEKVRELEKLIKILKMDEYAKVSQLNESIKSHKVTLMDQEKIVMDLQTRLQDAEGAILGKSEEVN